MNERLAVDVVVDHPVVRGLGVSDVDQRRAEAFAKDMARWLFGRPTRELAPLARVLTVVAAREFRWTRRLCQGRPLLAVEAAARATAALWPLLRTVDPEDDSDEEEPPPPEGEGDSANEEDADSGGDDEAGDTGEDDEEDASQDEGEEEASEGIGGALSAMLGEGGEGGDDPDLDSLIAMLQERLGAGATEADTAEHAADLLADVTRAASDGAMETDEVAQQLEQFLPGVGWSSAPGQLELSLLAHLEQLSSLLTQLPGLKDLARQLGRVEEAGRREGKSDGGREEVVGVRFGGDVRTALPAELGLLGDEGTEDLFYQRFVERRLVSLELAGQGDDGVAQGTERGPVIACIDTSASMAGPPELAAKALVLAVCRAVVPRGRVVHLLLFGGPGERTELRIRRGLGGLEGILAFLQLRFDSGTDFDGPLLRALELLDEKELDLADVLVVTDGLCRTHPDVVRKVKESKERRGVRVWSVLLGNEDARGVAPFSDTIVHVDPRNAAGGAGLVRALR